MHSATEFLEHLARVHERTRRIVLLIPSADLEWAPGPGRFTLGGLARHLAGVERWMYAETVHDRPSRYAGAGPETVAHYGHGLAIGTGGTPRVGVALTWKADSFGWDGAAIFGDSGSPVRVTNLGAAGDLTHLVVDTKWLPSFIAGTRIAKMLQIANGWSLVNSALCP